MVHVGLHSVGTYHKKFGAQNKKKICFVECPQKTLGKDTFVECSTLGERQLSAKGRQPPSKADGHYLCREPSSGTRQTRSTLGRASFAECQVYFYFFILPTKLFVVCSYTM